MNRKEHAISDRTCFLYQDEAAKHLLIQPIDEHDLEVLDQEVEAIKELSDKPFSLVAFMIKDWNQKLTPWAAPPVFGKTPFGDGAEKTLKFITSQLLPEVQENIPHLILGGYSLAGLFALWGRRQGKEHQSRQTSHRQVDILHKRRCHPGPLRHSLRRFRTGSREPGTCSERDHMEAGPRGLRLRACSSTDVVQTVRSKRKCNEFQTGTHRQ